MNIDIESALNMCKAAEKLKFHVAEHQQAPVNLSPVFNVLGIKSNARSKNQNNVSTY